MVDKLEDALWRGRGGKEKKEIYCVQSDVKAFDMAKNRNASVLKAWSWVETATEGGGGL